MIRQVNQLFAARDFYVIHCRIAVIGKPANYKNEKAFNTQEISEGVFFKQSQKIKTRKPRRKCTEYTFFCIHVESMVNYAAQS